jgi:hypothetical protein
MIFELIALITIKAIVERLVVFLIRYYGLL